MNTGLRRGNVKAKKTYLNLMKDLKETEDPPVLAQTFRSVSEKFEGMSRSWKVYWVGVCMAVVPLGMFWTAGFFVQFAGLLLQFLSTIIPD